MEIKENLYKKKLTKQDKFDISNVINYHIFLNRQRDFFLKYNTLFNEKNFSCWRFYELCKYFLYT